MLSKTLHMDKISDVDPDLFEFMESDPGIKRREKFNLQKSFFFYKKLYFSWLFSLMTAYPYDDLDSDFFLP